jgi:hypothetical protein
MNNRFIYDEKTSSLYAPDGTFLKVVSCPKAKNWNQLIIEHGEERWRKCQDCHENVIDLDVLEVNQVIELVNSHWTSTCIHASKKSEKVIFLKDVNAIPTLDHIQTDSENNVVIKTVRTIGDINRAASMGYAVDIRRIKYEIKKLRWKMTIGQDPHSGRIDTSGDYRTDFKDSTFGFGTNTKYREITPFFSYYPYFQSIPIAAYVIPKHSPDGTKVVVEDPIEDFVGSSWNQGDISRATNVYGYIENMKVVIDETDILVEEFIG